MIWERSVSEFTAKKIFAVGTWWPRERPSRSPKGQGHDSQIPLLVCCWVEHPLGFGFEWGKSPRGPCNCGNCYGVLCRLWERQRRLEGCGNVSQGHGQPSSKSWSTQGISQVSVSLLSLFLSLPPPLCLLSWGFPGNWPMRTGRKVVSLWKLPQQNRAPHKGMKEKKGNQGKKFLW